jgi:hypothetical protein
LYNIHYILYDKEREKGQPSIEIAGAALVPPAKTTRKKEKKEKKKPA